MAAQWLALRLQLIGVAMITSVAFLAVFEHHFNSVNPGIYILLYEQDIGKFVSFEIYI